jgi:hypothetical protein
MASIPLEEPALAVVKKALRRDFPDVSSSHPSEALAAASGRRTYATLLAELPRFRGDPPIELLDDRWFDRRLHELGYPADPEFAFEHLADAGVISTFAPGASEIEYRSARSKAWRNLMLFAINESRSRKSASVDQSLVALMGAPCCLA